MKATELRIGNLVQDTPFSIPREDMYSDGITKITGHGIDLLERGLMKGWRPIPLTEEWLLKFGFEKIVMNNMIDIIHYQNKDCWIYLIKDVFELELIVEDERLNLYRNWKYVHQLQNLYFALTGEEL